MLQHALRSLGYQNSLIEVSEGACAEVTCEGRGGVDGVIELPLHPKMLLRTSALL